MPSTSPGPLHGVRVLDLSSVVTGRLATQILGDLGADVITVEDPRGTLSRVMTRGPVPQLSGIALNLLRNKRNVVLDLKDPDDRQRVLDIAATVDVVVTNLRPGTLGRLRLSYQDIVEVRPDIVYCQAQGYPSDSPAADAPAYDDVIQAGSGIPDTFRRQGGEPVLVPTLVADKVSGLTIAYAVMAALLHRGRTGEGQRVEVPMIDVMTAFTLVEHAGAATAVSPQGPPGYPRILNPERQPQRTSDGWINVLAYTRENYEDLFRHAGRHDLAADERIESARSRIAHADSLYREVAAVLTSRTTTAEWLDFCSRSGIPASAVPTLEELVDQLPEDEHPLAGRYKVIPQPVRFSACPGPTVHRQAALSGQHNEEVMAEVAGWRSGGHDELRGADDDRTNATFGDVTATHVGGHVTEIEMHRPPANYFDAAILRGVVGAIDWAAGDGARAVVLCSEGRHFCAGLDFGATERPEPGALAELYDTARELIDGPLPVVVAVQGSAVGGGLGLALAGDFRVAAPTSRFVANFARLGFHQGLCISLTLPAVVGSQKALELLTTGRRVDGDEAFAIGLCDRLHEDPRAAARSLAAEIAAVPPLAVASIRRTMRNGIIDRFSGTVDHERTEQLRLMETSDFREGIAASMARRPPEFRGD